MKTNSHAERRKAKAEKDRLDYDTRKANRAQAAAEKVRAAEEARVAAAERERARREEARVRDEARRVESDRLYQVAVKRREEEAKRRAEAPVEPVAPAPRRSFARGGLGTFALLIAAGLTAPEKPRE